MAEGEKPKLFSYYRSSCSYRVRIALHYKKIEFDYVPIHLIQDGGEQNTNEYRSLNPMGQVPFYFDGNVALSQSMAIMYYLDQKHPKPSIFPENIRDRGKVIELCELINTGIQPLQNLSVLQSLENNHGFSKDDINAWCKKWIEKGLSAYEEMVSPIAGQFSIKHTITAADMFLVPQVYNANRYNADMDKFPTVEKITSNCLQETAFIEASPQSQPDTPTDN
ncbi:MAG: maleylacetoacetate isomerase [Bdellovibrionales bacterium]